MHEFPCASDSSRSRLGYRPGLTLLAVLMLSIGVGATTALFALVDDEMPPAAPSVRCETVMRISGGSASFAIGDVAGRAELRDRVSDAYHTGIGSARDAIGSLPDAAQELGERPLLAALGVGALCLLVACTRAASGLMAPARAPRVAIGATAGAVMLAAFALRTIDLPMIGVRSMAFALCISLLAVWFARMGQRKGAPLGA